MQLPGADCGRAVLRSVDQLRLGAPPQQNTDTLRTNGPGHLGFGCADRSRSKRGPNHPRPQVCGDMELAATALRDMVDAGFTPAVAAVNALLSVCQQSAHALAIFKVRPQGFLDQKALPFFSL